MMRKRILLIDNRSESVDQMREIFTKSRLKDLYEFDYALCTAEQKEKSKQKDEIIEEINKREFDFLVLDMLLRDRAYEESLPYLSLEIAHELSISNPELNILFVTGYATRKSHLTNDQLWDDQRYIIRARPEESRKNRDEGTLVTGPPDQRRNCPKRTAHSLMPECSVLSCTETDCFITFWEMLAGGTLK